MCAFSAIVRIFGLSLAAMNRLHTKQYDSIRGGIPLAGTQIAELAIPRTWTFGKVVRIVPQIKRKQ
jgi:hypothetical protein